MLSGSLFAFFFLQQRGQIIADALAFGETRSTRSVIFLRTETRRGAGVIVDGC